MNIIKIPGRCNFGNKIMQYLAACKIKDQISQSIISEISIPEINIDFSKIKYSPTKYKYKIEEDDFDILQIIDASNRLGGTEFIMEGFFQNIDYFPNKKESRKLLNIKEDLKSNFTEKDLVINIRCGDISSGVEWYPMIPVSFYKKLIEITGLQPVFLGQLDNPTYVKLLKAEFPDARYIPSAGVIEDFEKILGAQNICIAVSTYSWLAAWLSEAKQIFYPMAGFLHPALQNCYSMRIAPTKLVPYKDPRYRFFILPLFYGENINSFIETHKNHPIVTKEIDRSTVRLLHENGKIAKKQRVEVNSVDNHWYVKKYPDAAWEISQGWYSSPADHYNRVGIKRNFLPYRPDFDEPKNIIDLTGCKAEQSSISDWSGGKTIIEDATRVINAHPHWSYANHTSSETNPWWRIDFPENTLITGMVIYNRKENSTTKQRLTPFVILYYNENNNLLKMEKFKIESINDGDCFLINFHEEIIAKKIIISLPGENRILHLKSVRFLGK